MFNKQKYFIMFLLTGGLNTLISLLLFILLLHIGVYYLVASSITYIFGIIEGYVFTSLWVFNVNIMFKGLLKYAFVYCLTLLVNLIVLYTLVSEFKLHEVIAQITTIALVTLLNYYLIKVFVYRD
ncbi:MAG: GtrA family protein [Gammaproteobacteria bacterium]|nr:MAG: GtrA family protein [Gammaproteobacteria bacterium]